MDPLVLAFLIEHFHDISYNFGLYFGPFAYLSLVHSVFRNSERIFNILTFISLCFPSYGHGKLSGFQADFVYGLPYAADNPFGHLGGCGRKKHGKFVSPNSPDYVVRPAYASQYVCSVFKQYVALFMPECVVYYLESVNVGIYY